MPFDPYEGIKLNLFSTTEFWVIVENNGSYKLSVNQKRFGAFRSWFKLLFRVILGTEHLSEEYRIFENSNKA